MLVVPCNPHQQQRSLIEASGRSPYFSTWDSKLSCGGSANIMLGSLSMVVRNIVEKFARFSFINPANNLLNLARRISIAITPETISSRLRKASILPKLVPRINTTRFKKFIELVDHCHGSNNNFYCTVTIWHCHYCLVPLRCTKIVSELAPASSLSKPLPDVLRKPREWHYHITAVPSCYQVHLYARQA